MKCENEFCIYEDAGECILDEIQVDIQGRCDQCIHITLNSEDLKKAKENALNRCGD